jgi:cyclohexanone monooxygenase
MTDKTKDIDFEAVKRRYEAERAKRLRSDATDQFRALEGTFDADPFAGSAPAREPVVEELDVVVIGGGFAGLLVGARLREAGDISLRIIDKAADVGGTWYWNRYPGVRCDVESYIYLPLLEETGFLPSEKYASGPEILEHCRRIARQYRLYDGALFQTEVTGAVWDEAAGRWIVSTSRGDALSARFLVSCKGLYSSAKLPIIPGIDSFAGRSFHTSRWDYGYTGGDADGAGMVGLKDKTVGLIGTGCTGIQCVPPLAEWAKRLFVFQRTPSSIDVRGNRPTDEAWARSLAPGWRAHRMENFTLVTSGIPQAEDLVDDSWTDMLREITPPRGAEQVDPAALERAQMMRMERVRRRIEAIVEDAATAEALKPWYHYRCKRPGFSDDYLEAYNRPNVTLVDTDGKGVERITPAGVVVAGHEYPVDCLVYATGFEFMLDYTREAGFDLIGRGGLALSRHWSDGLRTLFGVQTDGFPNFFLVSLIQAGISFNYMHIADAQAGHIAHAIGRSLAQGHQPVEATAEAVDAWVDRILAGGERRHAALDRCTPGYITQEGRRDQAFELNAPFPGDPMSYLELLAAAE